MSAGHDKRSAKRPRQGGKTLDARAAFDQRDDEGWLPAQFSDEDDEHPSKGMKRRRTPSPPADDIVDSDATDKMVRSPPSAAAKAPIATPTVAPPALTRAPTRIVVPKAKHVIDVPDDDSALVTTSTTCHVTTAAPTTSVPVVVPPSAAATTPKPAPSAAAAPLPGDDFSTPRGDAPAFYINHVAGMERGDTVTIRDVFGYAADGSCDAQSCLLANFMVDVPWLVSELPILIEIPSLVVHGWRSSSHEFEGVPPLMELVKPHNLLPFGTHHSKMMVIFRTASVRVVVCTANFIYRDWHRKTQAIWYQDFPLKKRPAPPSEFENDFSSYFRFIADKKVNAWIDRLVDYDFSASTAKFIGSVPGYHSQGEMNKWGHLALRQALSRSPAVAAEFERAPVVCQFSSVGALDRKWLTEEFSATVYAAGKSKEAKLSAGHPAMQLVWPTVEEVRTCLDGYEAGGSILMKGENYEKDKRFIADYLHIWGGSEAPPHIKTYSRPTRDGKKLAWILITSSNLSGAAWGKMQLKGKQLMIRSYEAGVLLTPDRFVPKGEPAPEFLVGGYDRPPIHATDGRTSFRCPVPYPLPPRRYGPNDKPWILDRQYPQADAFGRHGIAGDDEDERQ